MTETKPLFFRGAPLDEADYTELATTHKLSFNIVAEVVDQIKKDGVPLFSKYSGTIRERVRSLASVIEATPEEEPPLVVDGTKEEDATPVIQSISENVPKDPTPIPTAPELEDEIDPEPKTEVDEVVDHAANGLMGAFSDPEGCFIITEDGCCTVNKENPPSIDHSLKVVENVLKLKTLGDVIEDKSSWMVGSIVAELEEFHGEGNFCVSQVVDETTKAYNTIKTATDVYKAFKDKRYKVSYTHHKEAWFKKIPTTDLRPSGRATQKLILHKAEKHGLNSKHVRALCVIAQSMEDDQVIKNIRSKNQAVTLIKAYDKAKIWCYVWEDDKMVRVRALAGEMPTGKMVIDTKTHTYSVDGGKSIDIPIQASTK